MVYFVISMNRNRVDEKGVKKKQELPARKAKGPSTIIKKQKVIHKVIIKHQMILK